MLTWLIYITWQCFSASHTKRHERASRCCVLCPISDHDSLVGMSVFVSDEDVGFHYSVYGTARHLASYPYTRPAKHVSPEIEKLFVFNESQLKLFSCDSMRHLFLRVAEKQFLHLSPCYSLVEYIPGFECLSNV